MFDHCLQVHLLHPEKYRELELFVNTVPLFASSPGHPFCGLVVNIGVATAGHIDRDLGNIGLVMAAGDYEGGQLCLYHAGLVLDLRPGDAVCSEQVQFLISTCTILGGGRLLSFILMVIASTGWRRGMAGDHMCSRLEVTSLLV